MGTVATMKTRAKHHDPRCFELLYQSNKQLQGMLDEFHVLELSRTKPSDMTVDQHKLCSQRVKPRSENLIHLIFFLSGTAGLIYEISWSRQLGLQFGHTVHAASVVLASYFTGMTLGYLLGARFSSTIPPLVGYAIAEIVIAIWAFVIPLLIGFSESPQIVSWLSHSSFALQTITRATFSFFLLLPATIALGVTLPMVAVYLSGSSQSDLSVATNGSRLTKAYALNTAGAMVGVLLATFYLLVVIGVRRSSYLAAGVSGICALMALVAHWKNSTNDQRKFSANPALKSLKLPVPDLSSIPPVLWGLSFLSGFGTLALQVLYTRMFSFVFHNSSYSFGLVVVAFLGSLALGAAIVSKFEDRFQTSNWLGFGCALGALATAVSIPLFVWQTELMYFISGDSFVTYIAGAILLVSSVVVPPVTCLGMLLPMVWKLAGPGRRAGQVVGTLTAVNSLAAAIGAVVASFSLLIRVGVWQSMILVALLFFIMAIFLLWHLNKKKTVLGFSGIFLATSIVALCSPVESEYGRTELGESLVRRWNSSYGWIDVVRTTKNGDYKIRQNLHYRFGTTGTNTREFRQAHLPLLLHQKPSDVLFLGLGTGLTAGGAIPHQNVKNIVVVELIPEVVEAARMLKEYNNHVVDQPNVTIHTDDARHYLLATNRRFDVIISDLFIPWESESGYLYTLEHFQIARQRMTSDGLFCQWLPLYQLSEREFELIANSFAHVFPQTSLWWGELDSTSPVLALIGTNSAVELDAHELAHRLHKLKTQLETVDPTIETVGRFWDLYLGDWTPQPNGRLNTDEHPWVEFLTPISHQDGKMIRGQELERLYNTVFANLPSGNSSLAGLQHESMSGNRHLRQRFMLFGK